MTDKKDRIAQAPALVGMPDEALALKAAGDHRGGFLAWADAGNVTDDGWSILLTYLATPWVNQDLRDLLRGGPEDV